MLIDITHEDLEKGVALPSTDLILLNYLEFQENSIEKLNSLEVAHLYVESAFLAACMLFIKEKVWIERKRLKGKSLNYSKFITPFFIDDLSSLNFFEIYLKKDVNIKRIIKRSQEMENISIEWIINTSKKEQKIFLGESLRLIKDHFIVEEKKQEGRDQSLGHNGPRLYRTFDQIDKLFELDYEQDQKMIIDYNVKERLYEKTGVGVQSGYSTILLSLHHCDILRDALVVDLGSGYGRVGLVYSLLRSDLNFIGYEYVDHRVDISNQSSRAFTLDSHLKFITQDLSCDSFEIPEADVYYLYDPFTQETYLHVLKQIVEVSKLKKVTVITKGNANKWLAKIVEDNDWPDVIEIDYGNLCIFKSR